MNQPNTIILNTSRRRQDGFKLEDKEDSNKFNETQKSKKEDFSKLSKSLEIIQQIYKETLNVEKVDVKILHEKLKEVEKNIKEFLEEPENSLEKETKTQKIQMKPLGDLKKQLIPQLELKKEPEKSTPRINPNQRESVMGLSTLTNKEIFDTTLKEDTEEVEKLNTLIQQQIKKVMSQLLEVTISNQKGITEIPIKDVDEEHMKNLYYTFKITKNDPKKPSFMKRNRIWTLDCFNSKILSQNGNSIKEYNFDDILNIEKNLNISNNLKLSFINTHEFELIFENSEERQKFYEILNHFQKTKVIFCSKYTKKDIQLSRIVFWNKKGVAKCNMSPQWIEGFSLFCFSWDMNHVLPKDEKIYKEFIPKDLDIYVFTVQRSQNMTQFFQDILGKEYILIGYENGWLNRIFVFIKVKHLPKLSNYEHYNKNWCEEIAEWSGTLSFLYRGFSSISFKLNETSFLFIGAQLSQGDFATQNPNVKKLNFLEMIKSIKNGKVNLDVNQFDFTFLMGNFGFGTSLSDIDSLLLIKEKNIKELLKYDDLFSEKSNRKMLVGFEEGDIQFLPTTKVDMNNPGIYDERSVPYYSTRIFYKFKPYQLIKQEKYDSYPMMNCTGNIPVSSTFHIESRRMYSSIFGERSNEKWIIIRGLHVSERNETLGVIKKPQLIAHGDFLLQNTYYSSKVGNYEANINPDLTNCVIPAMTPLIHQSEFLKKQCIIIELHDTSRTSSLIGVGVLSLSMTFGDEPYNFKIPLLCYTVFHGYLQGTIQTTKVTKM